MIKVKGENSTEITKRLIKWLNSAGFKAVRTNNIAVPGRRFNGTLGIPDITGFQKVTGRALYIEVKSGSDTLSPEQELFLNEALENNCIALAAWTFQQATEKLALYCIDKEHFKKVCLLKNFTYQKELL